MKKRKLLFVIGSYTILTLLIATIFLGVQIERSFSSLTMEKMRKMGKSNTGFLMHAMQEYKSLPWLFDYWQSNGASLDVPVGGTQAPGWSERAKKYYDAKNITTEEAEALSGREQKDFAEYCYLMMAKMFDDIKNEYNLTDLTCTYIRQDPDPFIFFQGEKRDSEILRYPLGESWPYTPDLHPVVKKIYRTNRGYDEIERVRFSTDRLEYLALFSPIIIDGRVRAVICEYMLWSDVRNEILKNVFRSDMVNVCIMMFANLCLMGILYQVVIRRLSFLQSIVSNYAKTKDSTKVKEILKNSSGSVYEIEELSLDVSDMIIELQSYIREVSEASAQKATVDAQLSLAASIQQEVLPNEFPDYPQRGEFDIFAMMHAAKEVGGDFYDFFFVDREHFAIVIADVSDKGIPAAMFMMRTQSRIQARAKAGGRPSEILAEVNDILCKNNDEMIFVTVWLAIIDLSTGEGLEANAGHEHPVFMHDGSFSLVKYSHSHPLALFPGIPYSDRDFKLSKGDMIFVYTDGVTDATDGSGERFGEERMMRSINSAKGKDCESTLNAIKSDIDDFVKDAPQFDDITMCAFRYFGKEE